PEACEDRPCRRGQRDVGEGSINEPLDQRTRAGYGVVRLADGPDATVTGRDAEEHRRGRAVAGRWHDGPLPSVPVLDQRLVGAARSELLAHRPHVVGLDGFHAVKVVAGRAGIRAGYHRPPAAVEVLDQRPELSVRPLLDADRPHIRSGRCGGTEEYVALRPRLGIVRDRPVGAVPGLDERAVLEVTVQADAHGPGLAALRGDAEQC